MTPLTITIGGKTAAIKEGTTFDWIAENRAFSKADAYTLALTFPLRGCPRNRAIFGQIDRPAADSSAASLPCSMRCGAWRTSGRFTVTSVSEAEVRGQYLEGASAANNAGPFDGAYINEMALGAPGAAERDPGLNPPALAWRQIDSGVEAVALPWVNDNTGTLQNGARSELDETRPGNPVYLYQWEDCAALSWQPYLVAVTRRVIGQCGFSADLSEWEASPDRWLLVCNTLPAAWGALGYAAALPHWTAREFLDHVADLLQCEFDTDLESRTVTMRRRAAAVAASGSCSPPGVIDGMAVEISADDARSEYAEEKTYAYSDRDDADWAYECCGMGESAFPSVLEYPTFSDLWQAARQHRTMGAYFASGVGGSLLKDAATGRLFCLRAVRQEPGVAGDRARPVSWQTELRQVDAFAPRRGPSGDSAETVELGFAPVRIAALDDRRGAAMFLPLGSADIADGEVFPDLDADEILQPLAASLVESGGKAEKPEYYDKIYLGYWDGTNYFSGYGKLPAPVTQSPAILETWLYATPPLSLSLNTATALARRLPRIDPGAKYTFSWLSDEMPDPRAVYSIHGKRYVCAKVQTTFSADGFSQLKKGEFYRVID